MLIEFDDRLLDDFLDVFADVLLRKRIDLRIRICAVRQEHVNDFGFRIGPCNGTCKSGVTETLRRDTSASWSCLTWQLRLVETESAAVAIFTIITRIEIIESFLRKIAFASV